MYFLNIEKPKGITSFDVISRLRKKLNLRQIGHSGTLDPMASGVLQVAVGKATKLLDYLDSDKTYICDIKFGYVTDTFDSEGEKVFIKKPNFSKSELAEALNSFIGKTMQIPPKYSAIKKNGRKLCDLIRDNVDINIEDFEREIEIYSINLLEFNYNIAKIEVSCKKGVYIRSLVSDLGNRLGCGAYITNLIRTKAGKFTLELSDKIDGELHKLNPVDVLNLEFMELSNKQYEIIKHGNFIENKFNKKSGTIGLTKDNKLVSLAILSDNLIKPKRFFGEVL